MIYDVLYGSFLHCTRGSTDEDRGIFVVDLVLLHLRTKRSEVPVPKRIRAVSSLTLTVPTSTRHY